MEGRPVRYVARTLALLWACWWVFFETAEAASSGPYGQAIFFAVTMFGAVAIAWKWETVGGAMLVLEAVGALIIFSGMWMRNFQLGGFAILFAIMCAPPLVAGILFLISGRKAQRRPSPA